MYLRMQATRQRSEQKRTIYENLCQDFSESIREQAELIRTLATATEAKADSVSYFQSLKRTGQLLSENATLRLELTAATNATDRMQSLSTSARQQIIEQLVREQLKKCTAAASAYETSESEETIFDLTKMNSTRRKSL